MGGRRILAQEDVALLADQMRDIDRRHRISTGYNENGAWREPPQRLSGAKRGQGAFQAAEIKAQG